MLGYVYLMPFNIIYSVVVVLRCYWYFTRKSTSGEVIWIFKKSQRKKIMDILLWTNTGLLGAFFVWKILSVEMSTANIVCSSIFGIILIALIILENLPQKICENGLVTQRGFVAWSKMKSVKESKKADVVLIGAHEQANFEEKIYCRSEDKEELENYIRERIAEVQLEN